MKKLQIVLLRLTMATCWRGRNECILHQRIWKNLQLSWTVCDRSTDNLSLEKWATEDPMSC
jgi:hypothetical protein